ncbi:MULTISPECIES: type II secretion system protein GspL [Luteimonas]|uniref:type II secretion system protein GspL n=1 Tax=Luteimonas TaxID=83614 RepID=UPI000C7AB685|nr:MULTISPECIES: type II secretion system protein GspL [Luteimonas]
MTPPTLTRLTLLPRGDARAARMWWLDAAGTIVADGAAPPRATPTAARVREIVAVPGEAVRLLSLEIPTRLPAQALAAARLLVEDKTAVATGLHIAIAPPGDDIAAPRLVALADTAAMDTWLGQCAALGIVPDVLLPDCLLLAPADDGALVTAPIEDMLAVRTTDLAFTVEPALAGAIIADSPTRPLAAADAPTALAAGALRVASSPSLDLLQFDYARQDRAGRRRRRRLVVLATLAVLSPLVVLGVQALRDSAWAHWLQLRADVVALQHDPTLIGSDQPAVSLQARHASRAAPVLLALQSAGLFDALAQLPGARLDSYEFAPATGLRVGLVHTDDAEFDSLRELLAPHGIEPVALDVQPVDGGLRSTVSLERRR